MPNCMCGHSEGLHWLTNIHASCSKLGCKCMIFREVKEPELKRSETAIVLDQILNEDKARNDGNETQRTSETERRIRRIAIGTGKDTANNREDVAVSTIADGYQHDSSGRDESTRMSPKRDGGRNGRSGLRASKT